jgi:hypothetical protein
MQYQDLVRLRLAVMGIPSDLRCTLRPPAPIPGFCMEIQGQVPQLYRVSACAIYENLRCHKIGVF